MKNSSKGFTVVELVIVISAVAVLAAVLVPTFSEIIAKANLSTDVQLVRNMNVILEAESTEAPPEEADLLAQKLESNGISRLKPRSRFYTIYWIRSENVIVLANEDDRPVYPEGYSELEYAEGDWIDLKIAADLPKAPTTEFTPEGAESQTFTVTLRTSGTSTNITFDYTTTATEGKRYQATLTIPDELRSKHKFRKITVLMEDGDVEHEFVIREDWGAGSRVTAQVDIPAVTGNITINVSIIEFCKVTFIGDNLKGGVESIRCGYEKGILLHVYRHDLEKRFLQEGYMLIGATGKTASGRDIGDIYDEKNLMINPSSKYFISEDLEIYLETAPTVYKVELRIMGMGEDRYFTIEAPNPQDQYTIDLAELLGINNFTVAYKSITSDTNILDLSPTCGYNPPTHQLIIKNLKTDCRIICRVQLQAEPTE